MSARYESSYCVLHGLAPPSAPSLPPHLQVRLRDLAANIEQIIVAGCAVEAASVASEGVRAPGSAARVTWATELALCAGLRRLNRRTRVPKPACVERGCM